MNFDTYALQNVRKTTSYCTKSRFSQESYDFIVPHEHCFFNDKTSTLYVRSSYYFESMHQTEVIRTDKNLRLERSFDFIHLTNFETLDLLYLKLMKNLTVSIPVSKIAKTDFDTYLELSAEVHQQYIIQPLERHHEWYGN